LIQFCGREDFSLSPHQLHQYYGPDYDPSEDELIRVYGQLDIEEIVDALQYWGTQIGKNTDCLTAPLLFEGKVSKEAESFAADFVPLNQEYWCSWCGDNEKSSLPQNCINYHYHYQRDNPSCGNKMCVTCYNQHEGRCYPCEEKEQAAESFAAPLTFNQWSDDEKHESSHQGGDTYFEDWLDEELHSHGKGISLKRWGDEEESESEHQHAESKPYSPILIGAFIGLGTGLWAMKQIHDRKDA